MEVQEESVLKKFKYLPYKEIGPLSPIILPGKTVTVLIFNFLCIFLEWIFWNIKNTFRKKIEMKIWDDPYQSFKKNIWNKKFTFQVT